MADVDRGRAASSSSRYPESRGPRTVTREEALSCPGVGYRIRDPELRPLRTAEAHEELGVGFCLLDSVEEGLHRLDELHVGEHLPQHPDAGDLLLVEQQLFAARSRTGQVERGIDAAVGQLAHEVQLAVAGALELFEDHFVHARARVDEAAGHDGQRSAFLDLAGGAEEALGALEGRRVDAARQDAARVRGFRVVGPRHAGDRVDQDEHVLAVLDEALGLLEDHLGDLDVARGRFVEAARDDFGFALQVALEVGDLFGALVDEQHDEVDLGMVFEDGVGDLLEEDRLAGARRRDDEGALALAERGDHVHDAHREIVGLGLEADALARVERREALEGDRALRLVGVRVVDELDLEEGEVLLAVLGRTDLAADDVAGPHAEAADLRGRDVDVVRAGQVVVLGRAEEAEAFGKDLEDALAEEEPVLPGLLLDDLVDDLLALEAHDLLDAFLAGELDEVA